MKQMNFVIYGNQENKNGNPIPYTRTTQKGKFGPKYMRYSAWKTYIVANYFDTSFPGTKIKRADFGDFHNMLEKKPVAKNVNGRVDIKIFFADETHPDPDNVVKGILDALFMDDKHIDVSTEHYCRQENPRVEVKLTLKTV